MKGHPIRCSDPLGKLFATGTKSSRKGLPPAGAQREKSREACVASTIAICFTPTRTCFFLWLWELRD